jgi:hypothetical protein
MPGNPKGAQKKRFQCDSLWISTVDSRSSSSKSIFVGRIFVVPVHPAQVLQVDDGDPMGFQERRDSERVVAGGTAT